MKIITNNLKNLGFGEWFQDHVDPEELNRFDIARVTAVHKESYTINNGGKDVLAELVGKMAYSASSPVDFPATGDWVAVTFHDEGAFAIIHQVLPRKSLLKRKTPGKKIDFQLIAANIDVALIVQSLDTNFNLRRLERYVVMAKESHIEPVVLLSKTDLMESEEIAKKVAEIQAIMPFLHVQPFSNKDESGLKEIQALLVPRQTYCLLGSSGVGKTTLLNNLMGEALFVTKTVREKDRKGRHATTSRQLIQLGCGALLIDTPGMRELGNFSVETGIEETFSEIIALVEQCRFNDCTHINEKGCAVLRAVADGRLSEKRYENYLKMTRESNHYEMSYLEKKQKDKAFGKMVKTVMKQKKNRR